MYTISHLLRRYAVAMSIIVSSALCLVLLTFRMAYTHHYGYSFLAWNLFLAWLPLISALIAYQLNRKSPGRLRFLVVVCAVIWLVFLPNAPYLVTDLIHLNPGSRIGFWFDLTMLLTFAGTGLLCGLLSIYWMQQIVSRLAGAALSWLFVMAVLALTSYGIYLGRFQHWNSWDMLYNPSGLLMDIWDTLRHPILHFDTYVFSALFTLFLIGAYLIFSVLTHLPPESES